MTGQPSILLFAYMGVVTLAVLVGVSLQSLISSRPNMARYAVAFSAGVMLAVCLLYLIPDALAFQHGILAPQPGTMDHASIGYSLSIGFFSLLTIERYLLRSHGHEHEHEHEHGRRQEQVHDCGRDHDPPHHHQHDVLGEALRLEAQVAWSTVLALCLHGLFDGVALYAAGVMPEMGTALATAITLHKVPEAATLLTVLRRAGVSERRRNLILLLYTMATPLGALLASQILRVLSERGVALLMAFVAGSLLHLVTGHLLPEATAHMRSKEGRGAFGVLLLGFALLLLARLLGAG